MPTGQSSTPALPAPRQVALCHLHDGDSVVMPTRPVPTPIPVRRIQTISSRFGRGCTTLRIYSGHDLCSYPTLPPGLRRDGCFNLYGDPDLLVPALLLERSTRAH